jgi:hypothetical protein
MTEMEMPPPFMKSQIYPIISHVLCLKSSFCAAATDRDMTEAAPEAIGQRADSPGSANAGSSAKRQRQPGQGEGQGQRAGQKSRRSKG